jgi:hypothetical protein
MSDDRKSASCLCCLGRPYKPEDPFATGAAAILASASDTVRDAPKGTARQAL